MLPLLFQYVWLSLQVVPTLTTSAVKTELPKGAGEPPRFVQPITSIDAVEGSRVVFETIVTGQPAPTVSWFREKEEITTCLDFQV